MNYAYLIVEGPHDAAFVAKILKFAGLQQIRLHGDVHPFWVPIIPTTFPHKGDLLKRVPVPSFHQNADHSIAIHVAGGDANIPQAIEESLLRIGKDTLSAVGVILDSDAHGPQKRFADLVPGLTQLISHWPATAGIVHPGPPRTGIFVLPDNQNPGTLEELLLESAAELWPQTLQLAEEYVATASKTLSAPELKKPAGKYKATVASISNLLRPGKAVQVSIQDDDWLSDSTLRLPSLQVLQSFLHELLALP